MELIRRITGWIVRRYRIIFSPTYRFVIVDDTATVILERTIFILKEDIVADSIAFKCPCGCKEDIYLNLLPDADPCWTWSGLSARKISIYPSVWRRVGCKSHFFIRDGKVIWV
jgi:hypothetical protein